MENDRSTSPDGRFALELEFASGLMSHVIARPTLVATERHEVLLAFRDSRWSLDTHAWLGDSRVRMQLRKYPGAHEPDSIILDVDCVAREATIGDQHLASLGDVEPTLDSLLRPRVFTVQRREGWLSRAAKKLFGR